MPTSEADCPFCEIVQRENPDAREVYRDEHVVAFFPLKPATLGHTLVVPHEHLAEIWDVDDETACYLAQATLRVANAVRRAVSPAGLTVIQSTGKAATQTVPHVHVHVVPRWEDDDVGRIWPPETNYSDDKKDSTWERVRAELRRSART